VCGEAIAPLILREIPQIKEENLFVEPIGKNTAPAIGVASLLISKRDPDGVMAVFPSDHWIEEQEKFLKSLSKAIELAESNEGYLVTFGIKPTRAETGYGYIEVGERIPYIPSAYNVKGFKEKPNRELAEEYLSRGNYLWNSGMFVWKVSSILEAIHEFMPELYKSLTKLKATFGTPNEKEGVKKYYEEAPSISIDYGVMERAQNVALVLGDFSWDDIGAWDSMERIHSRGKDGNIILGNHLCIDTKESIVVSDEELIATLGVSGLIVVNAGGATLVCSKEKAGEVRRIVELLKKKNEYKRYL
jgi:mannose-1-phosphate guanylyltransferase